jgi:hypothetical protein
LKLKVSRKDAKVPLRRKDVYFDYRVPAAIKKMHSFKGSFVFFAPPLRLCVKILPEKGKEFAVSPIPHPCTALNVKRAA